MFKFLKKHLLIVLLIAFAIFSTAFSSVSFAADKKDTVVVGVATDRCPMIYKDDNEIVGFGIDLLKEAAKNANINIEFKSLSETNYKDALDNPEYDLIMPISSTIKSSSGKETVMSESLMEIPFVFITLDTNYIPNTNALKVGMLDSMRAVSETIQESHPNMQIILYKDIDKLVSALRKKEITAILYNTYLWSYHAQKPSYSDLKTNPTAVITTGLNIGAINTAEGRKLIENLNEGIEKIDDSKRKIVILDYTSRKLYKNTFSDYIYEYKFFILSVILLDIFLVIIFVEKQKVFKLKNEAKIKELINKDSLTGALSINGFKERAKELIENNQNTKYMIAYVNFKNFKYINNTYGKKVGDDLLKFLVAKSLEVMNGKEIISRIENDHFVVLREMENQNNFKKGEDNIILPIKNYFLDKGKETIVQICCGLYILTKEDYKNIDIDHMIDLARITEQKIRLSNKEGFDFYNPNQWEKNKWVSEITSHLPFAIKNGEIQVYYQPQVNYETGNIIGAEALCRWNHANLGWISPGVFIPILEESGFVCDLDYYVWKKVCSDLARWNSEGIYKTVSINVSRFDIKHGFDIVNYLHDLVQEYNIDIKQLNIEITETACIENMPLANIIKRFRDLGFKVEIDDFGSGYSSLNMLKEMPIDRIKMDLRFLSGENIEEKGKIIIECMIFMAKRLGINFIAEGVETVEQANMLKSLGCTDMQGYLFYKPLPVNEFEEI